MKGIALVLGDYVQSITVVRSLARAGLRVVVGRHDRLPAAALSRHTAGVWRHPDPHGPAFGAALERYVAETRDLTCVFPVGESDLSAVMPVHERVSRRVAVAMPPPDVVRKCLDKPVASEIAAAAGLKIPVTQVAVNRADLERRAALFDGPFIVKCPDSTRTLGDLKALVCGEPADLADADAAIEAAGWPLVLQSYVRGERRNCHFLAVHGELVGYFEDRTLRTDRPDDTGYAIDGESIAPTPSLKLACSRLVAALGYHGAGCAQFLVDPHDGETFLELNPRLDATCELPVGCGVDFPRYAAECAQGRTPAVPPDYPVGRHFHWLLGDLRGIIGGLRRGRLDLDNALREAGSLLRAHWRADVRLTAAWSDPLPTLFFYMRDLASFRPRLGAHKRKA